MTSFVSCYHSGLSSLQGFLCLCPLAFDSSSFYYFTNDSPASLFLSLFFSVPRFDFVPFMTLMRSCRLFAIDIRPLSHHSSPICSHSLVSFPFWLDLDACSRKSRTSVRPSLSQDSLWRPEFYATLGERRRTALASFSASLVSLPCYLSWFFSVCTLGNYCAMFLTDTARIFLLLFFPFLKEFEWCTSAIMFSLSILCIDFFLCVNLNLYIYLERQETSSLSDCCQWIRICRIFTLFSAASVCFLLFAH